MRPFIKIPIYLENQKDEKDNWTATEAKLEQKRRLPVRRPFHKTSFSS